MTQPQSPTAGSNWEKPFFMVWTAQAFSLTGNGLVQFALVSIISQSPIFKELPC